MDKVALIRDDVVMTAGKQTLLDTIANAYDSIAKSSSHPVAIVFALVCEKGEAHAGYHTLDPVEDRNVLYITRGICAINAELPRWDKTVG